MEHMEEHCWGCMYINSQICVFKDFNSESLLKSLGSQSSPPQPPPVTADRAAIISIEKKPESADE